MSNDGRHNGWTNYATWRVNLEIFDGMDAEDVPDTAEECRDLAECIIFPDGGEGLAFDYARTFLGDVNWREIAEAHAEERENIGADGESTP